MVELHIKENEIPDFLYYIIIFNSLFPNVLEECKVIIHIIEGHTNRIVNTLTYARFISTYDTYGLNKIAQ